MSDTYLCMAPNDPQFVPTVAAQQVVLDRFRSFFTTIPADSFDMAVTDHIEVIHPIQYFDGVSCPSCKATLDEGWWYSRLEAFYKQGQKPADLAIMLPCCNTICSLNDLGYKSPVGFARFRLRVLYPDRDLEPGEIEQLEGIVGSRLRRIWIRL